MLQRNERREAEDEEDNMDTEEAAPSSGDLRNLSIIRSIPFVIPFMQRVKVFNVSRFQY